MIENKVEQSGLIQLDPFQEIQKFPVLYFDIATLFGDSPFLREKDFRAELKTLSIDLADNKCVGLFCSADIILPKWAFMLCVSHFSAQGIQSVVLSTNDGLESKWRAIRPFYDFQQFYDKRIIIKGCSKFNDQEFLSDFARELTNKAANIMFGEACSAVPINKKRKV